MSSLPFIDTGPPAAGTTIMATTPVRLGTAFAATVTVGYALCTLAFWIFPEASTNFMNALFHGLDFRRLRSDQVAFTFGSFVYGLVVMTAWAFAFGTLFGWIARRLNRPA